MEWPREKETEMPKLPEPLPIRQTDDGEWEVKNDRDIWIKCDNESDARILSNAPIVRQKSFEVFHPNEESASELDKTAEKMEQYNMIDGARYFRAIAARTRGQN
jgi:hypothetical protein